MQGAIPARESSLELANAFPDGWGKIPNNPLVAAAIESLLKGGTGARSLVGGWVPDADGRLTYRCPGKHGGQIVIYADPATVIACLNGVGIDKQWAFIEGISPLTVDVLLAVLAQLCAPGPGNKSRFPPHAPVPITADAILRYKGLRRWGSEGRQLRRRVDEEIMRLQGLRFDLHQFPVWDPELNRWNSEGVSVIGDSLFDIIDSRTFRTGSETSLRSEIVWLTRFGHWSRWWMNSQTKARLCAIPRRILEFDHRRNRGSALLAKKISLNTMMLWGALRSSDSMDRRIDRLLQDIGELPVPGARDSHWGGRVRDRLDEAILQLKEDRIFGQFEWPRGREPGGADRVKGWVDAWLISKITLTRPGEFGDSTFALDRKKKRRVARQNRELVELRRGSVIRSMRMDRNISQTRFAGELGISAAYLSQIENEKRAVPKVLLERIAAWARANEHSGTPGATATGSVHSLDAARDSRPAIGFRR